MYGSVFERKISSEFADAETILYMKFQIQTAFVRVCNLKILIGSRALCSCTNYTPEKKCTLTVKNWFIYSLWDWFVFFSSVWIKHVNVDGISIYFINHLS